LLLCLTHFWWLTLTHLQSNHLPSSYCLLLCLTHFWWLTLAHLQSTHLPNCVLRTYLCHPFLMVDICTFAVHSSAKLCTAHLLVPPISDGWHLHIRSPLICQIVYCALVSPISDGWHLHISSYFSSDSHFVMCWYRGCAHCRWGKAAEHRLQLLLFPRSKWSVGFSKVLCLL